MKKFLCACFVLLSFVSIGKAQDILLSSYVDPNGGIPANAQSILKSRLDHIISSVGFGCMDNQQFILTSKIQVLSEDITPTAPAMFAYTLLCDLSIGDGLKGIRFSSMQMEVKGVGTTKERAYQNALKSISAGNANFQAFVTTGKERIIQYFNANGEAILKRASNLAAQQRYEEAMMELAAIPEATGSLFSRASQQLTQVYTLYINEEGERQLAEARAIWSAGQDREAAEQAGTILAQINPHSTAYKGAQTLFNNIYNHIRSIDQREWNYKLQELKAETSIRSQAISALRAIGVAQAQNRPRVIYHIW